MYGKKIKKDLLNEVKKTVTAREMLQKGDSVLVSVSGGPDSVFLTHALLNIKDEYKLKIYCFHLDHKTREGQSGKDAIFVENFCSSLGLKLFKKEIDAHAWCREKKLTFQEGARNIRIDNLKSIAKKHGINKIATGHTADDSIETFFMNLFRGSAMRGLCGIKPSEGVFIRPLINCRKNQIKEYLDSNGIRYCIDRTNLENVYFRNRIRNLLIPFINEKICPGFEDRVLKTIEILRQEEQFLATLAKSFLFKKGVFETEDGKIISVSLKVQELSNYPVSIQKRIIISAVEAIRESATDIKSRSLEEIVKFIFYGGENKKIKLSDDLWVKKEFDTLKFYAEAHFMKKSIKKSNTCLHHIIEPGTTVLIKELNVRVYSEIIKKEELLIHLQKKDKEKYLAINATANKKTPEKENKEHLKNLNHSAGNIADPCIMLREKTDPASEAYLDFDKIYEPVSVMKGTEKAGQSFIPLGMKNFKKLHDFFIDAKIPASRRSDIPLFFDREKIMWVAGMRIDERAKVDKK
ncbi:MAG: tRNA lysidine(34) synthetase TilS, partial [Actinobacteria bacterium]|nr:tRNA lysidine(34) synthetase TilS [Actinomycetota bacterium]